ncbi:hypothetical protein FIV32_02240 [Sphingomonadales bacterium 58]|uniref:primase-like DNA-binding domain-containing protein n=1 Tax=Sphingobium sp. S8 TaxID=2758385 RepID=UPI0019186D60|nr:primase-like DNA-binding domain-containing protein [Sphingobium sp. S8]MBY2957569.1 hypothetical protein [Sphingomonadales bacterium 58]CAD7335343.1 hypothetical protein SPHS8_00460 [Sphingobium sp. S8]
MINDRLLRLECLKLAMQGPSDTVLERARAYSDFVMSSAPSPAAENDPLDQFLADCSVLDDGARVPCGHFHDRFLAWSKGTGAREWTAKGLSKAMLDKGFEKRSTEHGTEWVGLTLVSEVSR